MTDWVYVTFEDHYLIADDGNRLTDKWFKDEKAAEAWILKEDMRVTIR